MGATSQEDADMNIVMIGGGTVGSAICAQLASEGHDLTVVDADSQVLTELSNIYDVAGVVGNGASISVLRKAGAEKAERIAYRTLGKAMKKIGFIAK